MEIGLGVIAGTHDEIGGLFVDLGFLAVEADPPAPLVDLIPARDHGVVTVGRRVMKRFSECRSIFGTNARERPAHASLAVAGRDLRVAVRANGGINVFVRGARSSRHLPPGGEAPDDRRSRAAPGSNRLIRYISTQISTTLQPVDIIARSVNAAWR